MTMTLTGGLNLAELFLKSSPIMAKTLAYNDGELKKLLKAKNMDLMELFKALAVP